MKNMQCIFGSDGFVWEKISVKEYVQKTELNSYGTSEKSLAEIWQLREIQYLVWKIA